MVKVAIMGFGTVGSGVYEVLRNNRKSIMTKTGKDIDIKYILDIRDFPDHPEKDIFTKNFDDILNDPEVSIVAEVMGGLNPAYDFTKRALSAGKNVVTSNKELVATYGDELMQIAKANGVKYLFEASVGGGIPIIRPMSQCLNANNIISVAGILNGTTNFILNQMISKGKSFDVALKEAQDNGYAEKDPTADIEGFDASRKISILGSLATGGKIDYNNVYTKGISDITLTDIEYASKIDSVIKLIGFFKKVDDNKCIIKVSPMVVSNDNLLSGVNGVYNAVMVEGDAVGKTMFYGHGAGKLATASAVCGDIVDIAENPHKHNTSYWEPECSLQILPEEETVAKFLVTIKTTDKNVSSLAAKIGIEEVIDIRPDEVGVLTKEMMKKDLLDAIGNSSFDIIKVIQVLG